ncbi:MAG: APC family permease, partial [Armatimonadetes bacterium]|nr:APC family permease [Armatimonadota bacterium]
MAWTYNSLRRLFLGSPLPTAWQHHTKLPVWLGLPVFSSDALSSVAYGTEEVLLVLLLAGAGVLHYSWNISIGVALLLAIVAISYRQTIHAYPNGGGSYIVARENLGVSFGLVAGAALLIDYVLTVAVSTASGVAAIVSALPQLAAYRVDICLLCILFVALANLRGAKESGLLFAFPTYLFVGSFVIMIGYGLYKIALVGGMAPVPVTPEHTPPTAVTSVTLLLILRAFSSGCAALTGVEAVSNGVPAFKKPESRNAAATLTLMAVILSGLFLGISYLANAYRIIPDVTLNPITHQFEAHETVVSMIARGVFGRDGFYYVIQAATAMILILAANTSFADFPRLAQLLAKDRFLPRQFANIGDRLVFANGIIVLWFLASLLLVLFRGQTHALIPLYAVGVFLS